MRERHSKVMSSIAVFEARIKQSEEQRVQVESTLDQMRFQVAQMQAEKDIFSKTEASWQQERQHLLEERKRLNELISSLQTVHGELERNEAEVKQQLRSEKERTERELAELRTRLAEESAELKATVSRKEIDLKDLQLKYDRSVEDSQQRREEIASLNANIKAAEAKADMLQGTIAKKDDEIRELRMRSSTIAAATLRRLSLQKQPASNSGTAAVAAEVPAEDIDIVVEAEQAENELRSRERQLESELQRLRVQLKEAQNDIERQRKHAETYQEISKSAEEKLTSLNDAYEEYRSQTDETILRLETENSNFKARLEEVQSNLDEANSSLESTQQRAQERIQQLEHQLSEISAQVESLRHSENAARQNQSVLQSDLKKQRAIAEEAYTNYESELIKHARDMEQLSSVRETLQRLQNEKTLLSKKLESSNQTMAEAEAHWQEQKSQLEKRSEDLSSRMEDLQTQNNLLHTQIETLSAQVGRLQRPLADLEVSGEDANGFTEDDRRRLEQFAEVIRYMRREKEVLGFEKEAQLQENRRLQQQLEHANSQIEETRTLLVQERHRHENGHFISNTEHAELLGKVNQLDLLRESNDTLRRENNTNRQRADQALQKVQTLEQQLVPLQDQLRVLQVELESRSEEIKVLEEDNSRWKNRTQQILAKYDVRCSLIC